MHTAGSKSVFHPPTAQVTLGRAAFSPLITGPVCMVEIALTQEQDLTFGLVKLAFICRFNTYFLVSG